jgi:hypothetical protein
MFSHELEDHVDLESLGDLPVNSAQELKELAVAVPGKTLADNHSGQHVQRGEQGRCPVALVVVGHRCGPAILQRQRRLRPVERLDLVAIRS